MVLIINSYPYLLNEIIITSKAAGLQRKAHSVAQRNEDLQRKAGTVADRYSIADSPNFSLLLIHQSDKRWQHD